MNRSKVRKWASESRVLYHAFEGRPGPLLPLVSLEKATVFQQHPTTKNATPLFHNLTFSLDSDIDTKERWAVISRGDSLVRTNFLRSLQGHFTCVPPHSRTWPYLASEASTSTKNPKETNRDPSRAIQYLGFSNQATGAGGTGTQGAYLGARYESRKETTDWSLRDYLRGTVSLNLSEEEIQKASELEQGISFRDIITDLKLETLLSLPVGNLSNGQTRRARIAKALLRSPELLMLDEPFAGLDPVNSRMLSEVLAKMADRSEPRMILALPPAEVPEWITHVIHLELDGTVFAIGDKDLVYRTDKTLAFMTPIVKTLVHPRRTYKFSDTAKQSKMLELREKMGGFVKKHLDSIHKYLPEEERRARQKALDPNFPFWDDPPASQAPMPLDAAPLVEMDGVKVTYGDKCVLGDWTQDGQSGLHWTINPGERWGIFGPNGSGKTTLISLLTSDHPQAYSLPIKLFGRSRLPTPGQPGLSVFDLQSRIGHSSPEVHTYFPKHFTIRQTIESAWADAFHSRPRLSYQDDLVVSAGLRWFQKELDPGYVTKPDVLDQFFWYRKVATQIVRSVNKYRGSELPAPPHSRGRQFEAWCNDEARWADMVKFSDLSLCGQRVALFLRAVIKKPDIVVLDEAFSGMDERSRKKCMLFLAHGDQKWVQATFSATGQTTPKGDTPFQQLGISVISGLEPRQALICVSHRKEELPFVVDKWLRLPEANEGKPVVFGTIDRDTDWWAGVWNKEA